MARDLSLCLNVLNEAVVSTSSGSLLQASTIRFVNNISDNGYPYARNTSANLDYGILKN